MIWSEDDAGIDSALFAYNRDSGQLTQVAQADGPATALEAAVDQGKLLWSQFIGPAGPSTLANSVVKLDDLTTGNTSTLATGAICANLAWPLAAWSQLQADGNGGLACGPGVIKNLVTGQTLPLAPGTAGPVISGTSVAYGDSQSVYLLNDETKSTTNPHTRPAGMGLALSR